MPSARASNHNPPGRTLIALPASLVIHTHTILAFTAFLGALLLALGFHYEAVCKNDVAGWPEEWWPSVSASIGDNLLERAPFQILIALNSGPRMILTLVQWLITRRRKGPSGNIITKQGAERGPAGNDLRSPDASDPGEEKVDEEWERGNAAGGWGLPEWVAVVGVIRTFTCGGWVYVTSSDQHDYHDMSMIAYMILTIPWMFGSIGLTNEKDRRVLRWRRITCALFFASVVPLVYHFLQHKVHRVPGAYTRYAFFEWGLILFDVAFDSLGVGVLDRIQFRLIHLDDAPAKDTAIDAGHGERVPAPNVFRIAEPILPPILDVDKRMEYAAHEGGWASAPGEGYGTDMGDQKYAALSVMRKWMGFLSDVFLAYCFWTIFTGLGLQLFYFSVWKLALSGSELALLSLLSPFALQIPALSRYASSRRGQSELGSMSAGIGLLAYKGATPAIRLSMVMIATSLGLIGLTGSWARLGGGADARSEGTVLLLGLLFSLPVKFANHSLNPLWCIVHADSGGWNKTGVAVAALACLEKRFRPLADEPFPEKAKIVKENRTMTADPMSRAREIALSLGLGALLSLVQTLLVDAGTVISWTWTGFPAAGPILERDAPSVIAVAAAGLGLSTMIGSPYSPKAAWRTTSPVWGLSGCVSCYFFTYYEDWLGFAGGCGLVFYLAFVFSTYVETVSRVRTYAVVGWAFALVIVIDVLSVLTVAYAFVPGGKYFRERTDLIMGFSMLSLMGGNRSIESLSVATKLSSRKVHRDRQTLLALLVIFVCGLTSSSWVRVALEVVPYLPANGVWTGGIWTVHFGVDLDGRDSQERMLRLIRDMQVDVIGLLETDLHRFVYGNRDLTRKISQELGYYVDLGPGPNKHTWGAALLSKFPILESTHHLLPSPHGELAPAIHAKLLIHGQVVNVMVSHNGQEEDALDRELQSQALAKIMRDSHPEPFVFLGYLVTETGAGRPAPYEIIMLDGRMWDVEWEDRGRWCQYIALRNVWRVAYAKVSESDITDTELQASGLPVARFVMPRIGTKEFYVSNDELYYHTFETEIPAEWRLPEIFRGNGTRGHRYIGFDGPVYYLPPDRFWDDEMLERFVGYGPLGASSV